MRVALVHDYLSQDGGAERVLQVFHDLWPEAPLHTLFYDPKRANPVFRSWDIKTTFFQKLPGAVRHYRWFLPLMPVATESLDLRPYDLVISSSSAFAKGVITYPDTLHISYCHTPTRYLWTDTHSYVGELRASPVVKSLLSPILSQLRMWDRLAADRVDQFIANSQTVRERINKYYSRDSTVIHPPVNVSSFRPAGRTDNYYLIGGRLVSYKRFDLVISAFNRLGVPLKIFGRGPEEKKLKAMAGKNIQFLGQVPDEHKAELYRKCIAFIHPHVEDFGITSIEAMASGRPVIALRAGGALETIIPGETGVFLDEQTWENLAHIVIRFEPRRFEPERIRKHAEQFDVQIFKEKVRRYVAEQVAQPRRKR